MMLKATGKILGAAEKKKKEKYSQFVHLTQTRISVSCFNVSSREEVPSLLRQSFALLLTEPRSHITTPWHHQTLSCSLRLCLSKKSAKTSNF